MQKEVFLIERFIELIKELYSKYPSDWWLNCYRSLPEVDDTGVFASKFQAYDNALNSLSDTAWNMLREKIIKLFNQNYGRRGKQPFFDQLNEAFAYEYLKKLGCSRIEFIQETVERKTPDIYFVKDSITGTCEVKTINNSDEELERYDIGEIFSSSVYKELNTGFLYKLDEDIKNAIDKFSTTNSNRQMIFFIIHFDDLTQMYFSKYRQQILDFIQSKYQGLCSGAAKSRRPLIGNVISLDN